MTASFAALVNALRSASILFLRLQSKLDGTGTVISKGASLVIEGADIRICNLRVDGALRIKSHPKAHVLIDGLTISNGGWNWRALNPDKPAKEEEWIRSDAIHVTPVLHSALCYMASRATLTHDNLEHGVIHMMFLPHLSHHRQS